MKLQVVMLDKHRTDIAIQWQNECVPFGRRLVTIELTTEQLAMLAPRELGQDGGRKCFETLGESWLEP